MPIPIAAIQSRADSVRKQAENMNSASRAGKAQDVEAMDARIDWLLDAIANIADNQNSLAAIVANIAAQDRS